MANGGNFCTLNSTGQNGGSDSSQKIYENNNLQARDFRYFDATVIGTFGVRSGKWYYEATFATGAAGSGPAWGWCNSMFNIDAGLSYTVPSSQSGGDTIHIYGVGDSGTIRVTSGVHNESGSNWADTDKSAASGQIAGIAVDFDNSKAYFSVNGSFTDVRSGQDPANGTNPCLAPSGGLYTWNLTAENLARYGPWYPAIGNWAASSRTVRVNFGQDSTFQGQVSAGGNSDENGFGDFKYAVPAGFLALCSGNLPLAEEIDPAKTNSNYVGEKQFGVVTYTGTGGNGNNITGLGFQPDLVWFKNRGNGGANYKNNLADTSRGITKVVYSDASNAEETNGDITSFDSDGFTVGGSGTYVNASSQNYVAWGWRANGGTTVSNSDGDITSTVQANTNSGFSIVTWTGNGSAAQSIGHGLGKAPAMIFVKNRDQADDWAVYHKGIGNAAHLLLNSTSSYSTGSAYWGSFTPTTSIFKVGSDHKLNASGEKYVAYVWAEVEGHSAFGLYCGNSNTNGTYVSTGFRPRLLMMRRYTGTDSFFVYDRSRSTGTGANGIGNFLQWNDNAAESGSNLVDFTGNGFRMTSTSASQNPSGTVLLYAAWGDVPAKYNNSF